MTSPYFMLILAYFLFKDKITFKKILAAVLAFTGCVFIIDIFNGTDKLEVVGVFLGLMSGLMLAAFTIGGKVVEKRGYSESTTMFYFFLFSLLLSIPFTDFSQIWTVVTKGWVLPICVLLMGVACTLAPNFMIFYSVRRLDPALISVILILSLIVATICGVVFFKNPFDVFDAIGIALVIIAIVILNSPAALTERFRKDKSGSEQ